MNQLLLGASVPFVIFAVCYGRAGFRAKPCQLWLAPLLTTGSAIWAVVPDLPRLLGMQGLYGRLAAQPWTNVFYFHHAIDLVEADNAGYLYGIVVIAMAFLGAAWRELHLLERH